MWVSGLEMLCINVCPIWFPPNSSDHSNYDSFYWMETFGDPGWFHHQQIAQLWGLVSLRLATSLVIPFNATAYASSLLEYLETLQTLTHEQYQSDTDAEKISLKPLEKAIKGLMEYAKWLDAKATELRQHPTRRVCYLNVYCRDRPRHGETEGVNNAYLEFERGFIGKGLPGRPIYKHVVYAPGIWEGYAGITFPSIREAIAEHRWEEASDQIREISDLLEKASSKVFTLRRS